MTGTQILTVLIVGFVLLCNLRRVILLAVFIAILRRLTPLDCTVIAIAAVAFVAILHANNNRRGGEHQAQRQRPAAVNVANDIGQPSERHIIRWPISPRPQPRRASLLRSLFASLRGGSSGRS